MDLQTFIISVYCLIDDTFNSLGLHARLRRRGPQPTLCDTEVLTLEVVGEFIGISQDKALFDYFRRHWTHLFPALAQIHRTTFSRQAANLWKVKEILWQHLIEKSGSEADVGIVDSFPLHVCQFARAKRCKRFRGQASYGMDHLLRHAFYGFRVHVRVAWPGVITRFIVAPAHLSDLAVVETLVDKTQGYCLADRAYWSPAVKQWRREQGLEMVVPYKKASQDPHPQWSSKVSSIRYRIETVFSQIVERYQVKRVWARDLWHFSSRVLRKVLSHTAAFVLNRSAEHSALRFARLLD